MRQSDFGGGQHVGRLIESRNTCLRKAIHQQFCAVAWSTADVHAGLKSLVRYASEEIDSRPGALRLELQVLSRVPICHSKPPLLAWTGHRTARSFTAGIGNPVAKLTL